MRTLVNDYAYNRMVNRILKWAILAAVVVLVVLGTLVIFTFDPCPAGAPRRPAAVVLPGQVIDRT